MMINYERYAQTWRRWCRVFEFFSEAEDESRRENKTAKKQLQLRSKQLIHQRTDCRQLEADRLKII